MTERMQPRNNAQNLSANDIHRYIADLKPTLFGKFFYYCLPYRKKIVMENLQRVFHQTCTPAEQRKIAQAFYSHLLRSVGEIVRSRFQDQQKISEQVTLVGKEYIMAAAERGKGVLLLTGHLGNWEVAPIAAILNFQEYRERFHVVRKTLGFKWLEKIVFHRFFTAGLQVIPKKNSLEKICLALENQDVVVFIFDQHASVQSKDGIVVDFFGEKAATYRSLAMIAENTGAAVIPTTSYRKPDGKHVLQFFPALEWITDPDAKNAIKLNTQHYNNVLEQMILQHPEQWLWLHRRWKV